MSGGSGPLTTIHGSLFNFPDADMYRIQICEPANFSATVTLPGFAIEQIYLFHPDGRGIAMRSAFNGPATLTNAFTSSLPPGEYLLAVVSFLHRPLDVTGSALWENHFDNGEYEPDGPGAANPIELWDSGGGSDGDYEIVLTGACFLGGTGPTCYANCDGSTNIPFLNVNDFICFQSAFAAGDPYANCDGSTSPPVLNVNDFICFQSAFAAGCSAP